MTRSASHFALFLYRVSIVFMGEKKTANQVSATASYKGLKPATERATKAAKGASKQTNTKPELQLRQALRARGLRYRIDVRDLPGKPDIVFTKARVAVFCDGDFWHGRNLNDRLTKLEAGHNAPYWVAKITGNVARDQRHNEELKQAGWTVLRYWETDISKYTSQIASEIEAAVSAPDQTTRISPS